jgi:Protein of unknown function (DUF3616)
MSATLRNTVSRRRSDLVRTALVASCVVAAAPLAPTLAAVQAPIEQVAPWSFAPALDNRKEAENISAAVCAPAGTVADPARRCLLVSDEVSGEGKRYVRFFGLDDGARTLRLGTTLELLSSSIPHEADVEGADFHAGRFYVVGSHGLSKGEPPKYQASRFHIHRFRPDARDAGQVEGASLGSLLAGMPEGVGEHACTAARWDRRPGELPCKPLQEHGLNIEGLADRDGQLYIGLRAPVLEGRAFIVRVAIDGVFGSIAPEPKVIALDLGHGVGIRDIARVQGASSS